MICPQDELNFHLGRAVKGGLHKEAIFLIQCGADPEGTANKNHPSCLLYATRNSDKKMVEILLNKGANPNRIFRGTCEDLITFQIPWAIPKGTTEFTKTPVDMFPLFYPIAYRLVPRHQPAGEDTLYQIIEMLLKAGANPEQEWMFSTSILGVAVSCTDLELAELLMLHGANPGKKDKKGCSPAQYLDSLEWAEDAKYPEASIDRSRYKFQEFASYKEFRDEFMHRAAVQGTLGQKIKQVWAGWRKRWQ